MDVYAFEEFVKTVISSEENIAFGSSLFSMPPELVIVLAVIVSIVIVCALAFVSIRKRKRPQNFIQQFEEVSAINREDKMILKWEPENPQSAMELEKIKGIGAKTAEKLKAVWEKITWSGW